MQEWQINKKLIAIIAVVLVVFILAAIFGVRFAASYYYQKGFSSYRENRYEEAKQNLSFSLKFNRGNPFAHYMLGRIALGLPDLLGGTYYPNANYQEVISRHKQAIQLGLFNVASGGAHKQALDDLGISYWYLGDYYESVQYYLELIRLYPESSFWPRFLVAEHYFERADKPTEALEILKPTLDLAQADSDYNKQRIYRFYSLLARLSLYFDDFSEAQKYAELAIKNAGTRSDLEAQIAHNIVALAKGRAKNFIAAESEIQKSNTLANSPDAHNCVLASAYYLGGNYQKAISTAKAMKKGDTYVYSVCLAAIGNSYLSLRNRAEAKKYYEEYLSLTDALKDKNIFVMRNRQRFADELLKLK